MTEDKDVLIMEETRQASTGGRRKCGYQYMMPSYVELDETPDSYLVVADALLENSSAHGLPIFYRARGYPRAWT